MPQNENEFYKDLALMGSQSKDSLHILNFGLYYIFGLYYTFLNNGTFTQGKNIVEGKYIAGGKTQESTTELPSGVENCAKILTKFFRAYSSTVILLDEPELHLEPRIVRRLFKFLIWFLIREKPNKNAEEEIVFNQVEMVLREYSEEKQMLQEKHPNYEQKQLFIASHSPILINEFLNMNNSASIYEFETKLLPIRTRKSQNSHEGVFTCIRKVDSQIHSILDNLGVKGSDILQTNGVIWVEGPSDIVYIQKWLEMYTTENSLPEFRQGSNFEFCMFGGAVLKYLYGEEVQGTKQENLVNIFKLNTRGFIIVDSDKPDLLSKDKSTFAAAKELMKDTLGKDRFWCDSNVQTIEKYAIKAKVETWKYDPKCSYNAEDGKTERSFKRVKLWNDKEITLSDFEPSLLPNIKKLYESIKEWNRQ